MVALSAREELKREYLQTYISSVEDILILPLSFPPIMYEHRGLALQNLLWNETMKEFAGFNIERC